MTPQSITRTAIAFLLYASSLGRVLAQPYSTTPEQALHSLTRRQQQPNTCPSDKPTSCAAVDPKLPSNFCCPADNKCISVADSLSAICCPPGETCNNIQVITCNITLQDPGLNKGALIFTKAVAGTLPQCGNACCPSGYDCSTGADGYKYCKLDRSKAIVPDSNGTSTPPASTTTNPSSTPTSTTNGAPDPSAEASGIDSTRPRPEAAANPFPPGVFVAGFFPGLVIGALGVLAWVILTGRHKKPQPGDSRASSPFKRPEMAGAYGTNTNGRRTKIFAQSAKSMFNTKKSTTGTPGLPFDNADAWKTLTPPENNPMPKLGPQIPAGPGARHPSDASTDSSMTYPPNPSRNVGQAVGRSENPRRGLPNGPSAYPTTPTRNGRPGGDGTADGEMITVYTPTTTMERPNPAVAPLRGMNSQRRSRESDMGPPNSYERYGSFSEQTRAPYGSFDSGRNTYDSTNKEVLTPARYDGGGAPLRPPRDLRDLAGQPRPERPETTFTDMLRQINFPDPLKDNKVPALPSIPKQYQ